MINSKFKIILLLICVLAFGFVLYICSSKFYVAKSPVLPYEDINGEYIFTNTPDGTEQTVKFYIE